MKVSERIITYIDLCCAHIQLNAAKQVQQGFIVQKCNDPKHSVKATQMFLNVGKSNILQWPNSHLISVSNQAALQLLLAQRPYKQAATKACC